MPRHAGSLLDVAEGLQTFEIFGAERVRGIGIGRQALRLRPFPPALELLRQTRNDIGVGGGQVHPIERVLPPIDLNTDIMNRFRSELQKFYYDETRFESYLEQLGIEYPTLKPEPIP